MKRIVFIVALMSFFQSNAQNGNVKFHSHNDYNQNVPFWNAYSQGMNSIEIDLVLVDNSLYVAHDKQDIALNKTIESLYLLPLKHAIEMNFGTCKDLQFLIDLKDDGKKSIELLVPILKKYEALIKQFDIQFVISGNKPELEYFLNLPAYIKIDFQVQDKLSKDTELLKRIGLVSYNFQSISQWKGIGEISKEDRIKLSELIEKAHRMEKPIRFWASPDTPKAWYTLSALKVDFINTDKPGELKSFMNNQAGL